MILFKNLKKKRKIRMMKFKICNDVFGIRKMKNYINVLMLRIIMKFIYFKFM